MHVEIGRSVLQQDFKGEGEGAFAWDIKRRLQDVHGSGTAPGNRCIQFCSVALANGSIVKSCLCARRCTSSLNLCGAASPSSVVSLRGCDKESCVYDLNLLGHCHSWSCVLID